VGSAAATTEVVVVVSAARLEVAYTAKEAAPRKTPPTRMTRSRKDIR